MKVSLLIPARNEAKSIYRCVISCLKQTYPIDEIIVVNDASDDNTLEILQKFENTITVISTPTPTGSKSYVQEIGLQHVNGDIVITTDADTILDKNFVKHIVKEFEDETVTAAAGLVKSLPHNMLTACRALEYSIGQEIHKYAQSFFHTLFVIPGCAAAYRTHILKNTIGIDHDTVTEDLDFTYKLHKNNLKIAYSKNAIVYTQDPATLTDYIEQLRRWYGGSWQNLMKHYDIFNKPNNALELSLIFLEGVTFPFILIVALLFSPKLFLLYYLSLLLINIYFACSMAYKDKRYDIFVAIPLHIFVSFINYTVFIEQFFMKVLSVRTTHIWFQPDRRIII